MIMCLNFQNAVSRGLTFFYTGQKNTLYEKYFKSFNIFRSRLVSPTWRCRQLFQRPHSFPVILCWNFENSKFSLFLYNLWYIIFLNIISQMHISVSSLLLNRNFWSSIALNRRKRHFTWNLSIPTGYMAMFHIFHIFS